MKTFLQFLNENVNPQVVDAMTSNPSTSLNNIIKLVTSSAIETWMRANGVKEISSEIYKNAGNQYYFGTKGGKYYIYMLNAGESFTTIKFSSLSEDDIKTLTKSPDIYLNPVKSMDDGQYKMTKDILTL
jgi:hypothetical protein